MKNTFKDKVARVTQAGSGIGRAWALAFAQKGVSTVVADSSVVAGNETLDLIKQIDGEGMFFQCDLGNPDDTETLIKKPVPAFGHRDYACNNAGFGGLSSNSRLHRMRLEECAVSNLNNFRNFMQHEIPEMIAQGEGVIVNLAAKHGVLGYTKTAALEHATQNIHINAVCPGFVYTPILERHGMGEDISFYHPLSGLRPVDQHCTPEDLANTVLLLCSNEASFMIGESLAVDNGYTAQ
jgi:NAD(P)-dependent dehydrogenase (short-subunit alcohol dehydrogenase family)